jgi:hypothetical protein
MFAALKDEISAKIENLGDFSKLKSVGKKVKRLGLLFSSAEMATILDPERCEDIDDISKNEFMYTDGCGLISHQLAKQIVQRRRIVHRNKRYLPSVFQIRYRGYKGVLTLCPHLKGRVQVQFRESMRKFKDVKDLSFSIVEYSKVFILERFEVACRLMLAALHIRLSQRRNHTAHAFAWDISGRLASKAGSVPTVLGERVEWRSTGRIPIRLLPGRTGIGREAPHGRHGGGEEFAPPDGKS